MGRLEFACLALDREARVPKASGYYKVTHPLYAWNGGTPRMAGDIRNTRTSNVTYGDHFCILLGNWSGSLMDAASGVTRYDVTATVNAGDSAFNVSTSDAENFAAGDLVCLFTSADMPLFGGATDGRARGSDVNEVESVNTGTATITVKRPVKEIIDSTPKAFNLFNTGKNDTLGRAIKWVKDFTLIDEGGSFASNFERWTGYGGMYDCNIAATIKKSSSLFSVNGIVYSHVDINGRFTKGACEIAYLSQDSLIETTRGAACENNASTTGGAVVVSEYARRLTLGDMRISTGTGENKPTYLLTLTGAKEIIVTGGVRIDGESSIANVDIQAMATGTFSGHRFLPGARFTGNSPNGIRITSLGGTNSDIEFNGIEVVGTFSNRGIIFSNSPTDIRCRNVYHSTGTVLVNSGSVRTVLQPRNPIRSASARARGNLLPSRARPPNLSVKERSCLRAGTNSTSS